MREKGAEDVSTHLWDYHSCQEHPANVAVQVLGMHRLVARVVCTNAPAWTHGPCSKGDGTFSGCVCTNARAVVAVQVRMFGCRGRLHHKTSMEAWPDAARAEVFV